MNRSLSDDEETIRHHNRPQHAEDSLSAGKKITLLLLMK
jgi:hypothetical protein